MNGREVKHSYDGDNRNPMQTPGKCYHRSPLETSRNASMCRVCSLRDLKGDVSREGQSSEAAKGSVELLATTSLLSRLGGRRRVSLRGRDRVRRRRGGVVVGDGGVAQATAD